MGRPRQTRPRAAAQSSRRDFFKRSGAALALGSVSPVAFAREGRGAEDRETSRGGALFLHGVASGDPLADRVILWTRVTPRSTKSTVLVEYELSLDPRMRRVVKRGRVRTNEEFDHTVKVDATGLRPDTTYYYRFTARGETSPIGRTKTMPASGARRLRMAVASCSSLAHGYFNAYRRIAERADLDLVVHLGDYLYEYGSGQYGTVRDYEPSTEIVTLSDYRVRHAQYKRDADLQELHRQHPMVCIWDDHEITNDAWRDGAQNHTEGAEGTWPDRVARGLRAYYEWMPIRPVDPSNPRRNYRSFRYGDLAELVMLEERLSARARQLPSNIGNPSGYFVQTGPFLDPGRQLLGNEQEQWLFGRLRTSSARWKLLGQGVMFAQLKVSPAANAAGGGVFLNADQWDGYQPARDRIYAQLSGEGQTAVHSAIDNVVVLTGDIHSSWAADLTPDPNNPVVASGGYDPLTGAGSRAVEFVGTSITSPGVDDAGNSIAAGLRAINPHFKYIDLNRRGYMLLDVTAQRAVCEWWYVDTVASRSNVQSFGVAFEVQDGANRLVPGAQTSPRPQPPALAP